MWRLIVLVMLTATLPLAAASNAQAQGYRSVVLSDSPLFYWNFNEPGDLDAAVDQVGSDAGDNLLPEGNATRVASGTTAAGASLGRAASFDGTQFTKFFSGALTPATSPDAWALEMWIRPQGPDPGDRFDYILESRGPNNTPGILYDYGNNDRVEIFHAGQRTAAGGPVLAADVWQHLVIGNFGIAEDRVDFFLNGAPAGSMAFAGDSAFGTEAIAVGNSVPGDPNYDHFNGQIDELAVYDLTGLNSIAIASKLASIASHYAAIPEPSGCAALALAGLSLAVRRRK
ncbi:MAG: LamG domain-containing protein [Pirellulales bacterium]|nr:LamG domain-containing protein [Pirellulales bacterium]